MRTLELSRMVAYSDYTNRQTSQDLYTRAEAAERATYVCPHSTAHQISHPLTKLEFTTPNKSPNTKFHPTVQHDTTGPLRRVLSGVKPNQPTTTKRGGLKTCRYSPCKGEEAKYVLAKAQMPRWWRERCPMQREEGRRQEGQKTTPPPKGENDRFLLHSAPAARATRGPLAAIRW